MQPTDVTIIVAALTALASVIGTWFTMRARMRSAIEQAQANLIKGYSQLVDDLRKEVARLRDDHHAEIARLTHEHQALQTVVARLEGAVQERDKHIERLTFAISNILATVAK